MGRIPIQASSATTVTIDGREILAFGGNNYAALAHHPEVVRALCDAAQTLGLTTTASRETTGNTTTHLKVTDWDAGTTEGGSSAETPSSRSWPAWLRAPPACAARTGGRRGRQRSPRPVAASPWPQ